MGYPRLLWSTAIAAIAAMSLPALAADAARDAGAGKALFTGARPLVNGGAPCGACHALGGLGDGAAASLGPDLSRSFEGLAADAIDGLLQDLPFPTMAPVYTGHALTPEERGQLSTFLAASTGVPAPRGDRIAIHAALLAALGFVALGLLGRRRKRPTRPLLRQHPPYTRPAPIAQRGAAERPSDAARASGGTR